MRYHGSKGQVKMDPTGVGGATAVAVASLNSWTLDMSRDKADVTAFGDTNKQSVVGLPAYKGSLGGFFDDADTKIFDVALGDTPAFLELLPSTLIPLFHFDGPAYIDANISVQANGSVNITGTFEASGNWTFEKPATSGLQGQPNPPATEGLVDYSQAA